MRFSVTKNLVAVAENLAGEAENLLAGTPHFTDAGENPVCGTQHLRGAGKYLAWEGGIRNLGEYSVPGHKKAASGNGSGEARTRFLNRTRCTNRRVEPLSRWIWKGGISMREDGYLIGAE